MKKVLHYTLVSVLATAMALASSVSLAAPAAEQPTPAELANIQADTALNTMVTDIVEKYGKEAAPAVLANRLGMLRALCIGVDPNRLTQALNGKQPTKSKGVRLQSMQFQQVKINHPLCRSLTAQSI